MTTPKSRPMTGDLTFYGYNPTDAIVTEEWYQDIRNAQFEGECHGAHVRVPATLSPKLAANLIRDMVAVLCREALDHEYELEIVVRRKR